MYWSILHAQCLAQRAFKLELLNTSCLDMSQSLTTNISSIQESLRNALRDEKNGNDDELKKLGNNF